MKQYEIKCIKYVPVFSGTYFHMLDFPAFCGCTYQHIPAHDSMYLIVLLFEFSCTLLARLKAAHLLQPYYTLFQAHPSLLLRRFHVAFPALPLLPTPPPPPHLQPFPERAGGVAAAAAAAGSASDAEAAPAPAAGAGGLGARGGRWAGADHGSNRGSSGGPGQTG